MEIDRMTTTIIDEDIEEAKPRAKPAETTMTGQAPGDVGDDEKPPSVVVDNSTNTSNSTTNSTTTNSDNNENIEASTASSITESETGCWKCISCTYLNENALFLNCEMCGETRPENENKSNNNNDDNNNNDNDSSIMKKRRSSAARATKPGIVMVEESITRSLSNRSLGSRKNNNSAGSLNSYSARSLNNSAHQNMRNAEFSSSSKRSAAAGVPKATKPGIVMVEEKINRSLSSKSLSGSSNHKSTTATITNLSRVTRPSTTSSRGRVIKSSSSGSSNDMLSSHSAHGVLEHRSSRSSSTSSKRNSLRKTMSASRLSVHSLEAEDRVQAKINREESQRSQSQQQQQEKQKEKAFDNSSFSSSIDSNDASFHQVDNNAEELQHATTTTTIPGCISVEESSEDRAASKICRDTEHALFRDASVSNDGFGLSEEDKLAKMKEKQLMADLEYNERVHENHPSSISPNHHTTSSRTTTNTNGGSQQRGGLVEAKLVEAELVPDIDEAIENALRTEREKEAANIVTAVQVDKDTLLNGTEDNKNPRWLAVMLALVIVFSIIFVPTWLTLTAGSGSDASEEVDRTPPPAGSIYLPAASGTGPFEALNDLIYAFTAIYPEVKMTVSSVGSGATQGALWGDVNCIKKPIDGLCDGEIHLNNNTAVSAFGMGGASIPSEAYQEHAELDLQMLPALGGPIMITYSKHVTGNSGKKTHVQLNMTAQIVAGIFDNTILYWDDPQIQSINPNIRLPSNERITVVVRADKSGMSKTLTQWIYHTNPDTWPESAVGSTPEWPLRNLTESSESNLAFLSAKEKNVPDISLNIKSHGQTGIGMDLLRHTNSIGYLELGYYETLSQFVSQAYISNPSNPTDYQAASMETVQKTMTGLLHAMDPDDLSLDLVFEETPLGGFPISRYVYWYIKKNPDLLTTDTNNCYSSWLLYKFIEWTYNDPLAEEIALGHGWIVPPPIVVQKGLEKLSEMKCMLFEGGGDHNNTTGKIINVESYTPPPYREPVKANSSSRILVAILVPCILLGILALLFVHVEIRKNQNTNTHDTSLIDSNISKNKSQEEDQEQNINNTTRTMNDTTGRCEE